jgi:hypothetical protein
MIEASCHCGSVRIEVPRKPRTLTDCNCSICRRTGARWAYYQAANVRIQGARDSMSSYLWGERRIRFVRCKTCGCLMHWQAAKNPGGRMGVNMRNVDPQELKGVRVRHLDGARTWKFLD